MAHAAKLVMEATSLKVFQRQGLGVPSRDTLQHTAQLRDDHSLMLPVALLRNFNQAT